MNCENIDGQCASSWCDCDYQSRKRLDALVAEYEKGGSVRMDRSLGFQKMPAGYALMLNADHTHFYWLRYDGQEGYIDWNKWRVRKGAIIHSANEQMSNNAHMHQQGKS